MEQPRGRFLNFAIAQAEMAGSGPGCDDTGFSGRSMTTIATFVFRPRGRYCGPALALGLALGLAVAPSAYGQSFTQPAGPPPAAAPQQAAPPQPAPPQPGAKPEPGVLESIGRFFDQGASSFREHIGRARERVDDFNSQARATGQGAIDVTRDAVGAVVSLPSARMVQGRQVCPVAANGAPDCQSAAERLCKEKGFSTGKSMDFTSSERCPPRVWVSGRKAEGECTTETFISRAICQ